MTGEPRLGQGRAPTRLLRGRRGMAELRWLLAARGRVMVALPHAGWDADYWLPLRRGQTVVADVSRESIRDSRTDLNVVSGWMHRGIQVWSSPNITSTVVVAGGASGFACVQGGDAMATLQADTSAVAILTNDRRTVIDARRTVLAWRDQATRLSADDLEALADGAPVVLDNSRWWPTLSSLWTEVHEAISVPVSIPARLPKQASTVLDELCHQTETIEWEYALPGDFTISALRLEGADRFTAVSALYLEQKQFVAATVCRRGRVTNHSVVLEPGPLLRTFRDESTHPMQVYLYILHQRSRRCRTLADVLAESPPIYDSDSAAYIPGHIVAKLWPDVDYRY